MFVLRLYQHVYKHDSTMLAVTRPLLEQMHMLTISAVAAAHGHVSAMPAEQSFFVKALC